MIKLTKMSWSNWFSYGDNNEIDFSSNTLTQILGVNGSGKSSIPLILEEILYGKNSKGIKKQDITNRYTNSKNREAYLKFYVEDEEYEIKLKRTATTTKLTLLNNGEDISSHTSTGTYKQIENIIGIDFKTFNQLIYQSSKTSLEFLTATDTQRKNFLITLLDLNKYIDIYEIFKEEYKTTTKVVASLEGSCSTIASWIETHAKQDLVKKEEQEEIKETDEELQAELAKLKHELENINSINKARSQNNQYKELLAKLDTNVLSESIEEPKNISNIIIEKGSLQKELETITKKGKQIAALKDPTCPTCNQEIDQCIKDNMLSDWRAKAKEIATRIAELDAEIGKHREIEKRYNKYKEVSEEFERLNLLIDKELPSELIDEVELRNKINKITKEINSLNKRKKDIEAANKKIRDHNAKVDLVLGQIDQYKQQLAVESEKLKDAKELLTILDILRQSFSTNGLISYKIEYLVKDLEEEINKYLSEFSSGRFQFTFTLKGEKLNIEIIDNGDTIAISALSSGELARVNISTLLAIRKLMSTISSTKINLLFLDEIMGVLDTYGKDKLIEVLLEEQDLNTFVVSHEYTHPLLEKITVVKDGNISRLENG